MLQERKGDHAEECVVVKTSPAAALEVIEPELLLHLLVRLLADPARLDDAGQLSERSRVYSDNLE